MGTRGALIDRLTQQWVRVTGRTVGLDEHPWLDGPTGDPVRIGDEWLEHEAGRLGGSLVEGGGLLPTMDALASETFDPSRLSPGIGAFYEHTADWRLDVWSQWCPAALPFGWLLSLLFSRRLDQLALPLRPIDAAQGMDSRVVTVRSSDGEQLSAAWLRTLRSNGRTVYSGCYGIAQLPNAAGPSVKVSFPLPNGAAIVFLEPSVGPDGALLLTSPAGDFGDNGAYLAVRGDGRVSARRIPLVERFRVYVDDEGVMRTDHALDLWSIPALRLHYRLEAMAA